MRKALSDTALKGLKAADSGKRYEIMDTVCPRLGVRVTDKGHRSFIYRARFPGSANPARRWIGDYPTTTLADARETARAWDALLAKGIDPAVEKERAAREAEKAKLGAAANTFVARAADYVAFCKRQEHRQVKATENIIKRELTPRWGSMPIDNITPADVKHAIVTIAEKHPAMARNVLVVCKSLFDWALEERSPAAALRPKKIIGKKRPRQRTLTDSEVRAFWKATEQLNYPDRELHQFLLLTGVRLREAAGARWSEIEGLNTDKPVWTIPAERFKSDAIHIVHLSPMAVQILEGLPRFKEGDCLFSHSFGRTPMTGFGKSKMRLDALMVQQGQVEPWVVHDLRRVVRTGLAKLKVPDSIAEMALGHGHGTALERNYNLHKYADELREALELWAGRVHDIVTPPPPNVTKLRKAG
jgi:integrase